MKKQLLYSIFTVLLLAIVIAGSTYAFFSASITSSENVDIDTSKFEVIYTGGTTIDGELKIGSKKEDGYNTTVNIKLAKDSVQTKANLYIDIEEITPNIAVSGFIWEVYGYKNNTPVYSNSGNFNGYNSTDNKIVNIVENYTLSEDNTSFTVYLWLDGNKTDNNVVGGSFKGHIGAKTENFTATF